MELVCRLVEPVFEEQEDYQGTYGDVIAATWGFHEPRQPTGQFEVLHCQLLLIFDFERGYIAVTAIGYFSKVLDVCF
ncbi:MAG: hypothetical protein DDT25_00607 [Chloroflexi bacterium]|nr:hypothetical protein [Chloroflexota bacterium]